MTEKNLRAHSFAPDRVNFPIWSLLIVLNQVLLILESLRWNSKTPVLIDDRTLLRNIE